MNNHITPHLVSLFVYHAVFKAMTWLISFASLPSLKESMYSLPSGRIPPYGTAMVATPLLCALAGMASMSLQEPISDRATFDAAMQGIFAQFEEFDEFPLVAERATKISQGSMNYAKEQGLAALEEALAGFPVSGGDFAVWEEHMLGGNE
jgi:hypothetical protein